MKRFILLLNHDDQSLSAYLQHCLAQGEQFIKASGNIFSFRKTSPSEDRIRVVTYANEDPDLKMKFQMEDYSALMKKRGWKILNIGNPEDIFDSKRHVFLQTDQKDAAEPLTDPALGKKAKKREKSSLIRCIAMLLVLFGFAIFFLGHDPDIFLSSDHIFFPCIAAMLFWTVSVVYCVRGVITVAGKTQCKNGFKNYLVVDKAVLFCMLSISALFLSLIIDLFLFPDRNITIVNGEQRIRIYQDSLPLSMTDLDIPMTGKYHSSRLTERNGLLMQSLYGSDQSFTDPEGTKDLSLISYTVYRSKWARALDWVASLKGYNKLPADDNLSLRWGAKDVHTDGSHRLSVRYPGVLFVFSASADINNIEPELIMEKLSIKIDTSSWNNITNLYGRA